MSSKRYRLRRLPPCRRISRPPGAAQTPEIYDFRDLRPKAKPSHKHTLGALMPVYFKSPMFYNFRDNVGNPPPPRTSGWRAFGPPPSCRGAVSRRFPTTYLFVQGRVILSLQCFTTPRTTAGTRPRNSQVGGGPSARHPPVEGRCPAVFPPPILDPGFSRTPSWSPRAVKRNYRTLRIGPKTAKKHKALQLRLPLNQA